MSVESSERRVPGMDFWWIVEVKIAKKSAAGDRVSRTTLLL
jgi:hypothetical protein